MDKLDYKRAFPDLYLPGTAPAAIAVPEMTFFAVDGVGEPAGEAYQAALQALYALSFTVKMAPRAGKTLPGYFDYVVPPLEGFWHSGGKALDITAPRGEWGWASAIRQPEFVTEEVFLWAVEECRRKKPDVDVFRARLWRYAEGDCVQILHVGPYATEPESLSRLRGFMAERGLVDETGGERRHHEIYLSDPRRTAPERMKTVLRLPVSKAKEGER